jgi:hypothetical protein
MTKVVALRVNGEDWEYLGNTFADVIETSPPGLVEEWSQCENCGSSEYRWLKEPVRGAEKVFVECTECSKRYFPHRRSVDEVVF